MKITVDFWKNLTDYSLGICLIPSVLFETWGHDNKRSFFVTISFIFWNFGIGLFRE